ncbi:hypothetical protein COU61_04365 [Candidatus Pacearchaeota archaeon CG10_big_fil_rev_8_21_14_0_10_35_13]|nr:MAG: hypothetical protein COU61_04365 [Candidatus Pacearchaeota archaeon CG10_big_fil_rev_8_21_14_0_10_35_13]
MESYYDMDAGTCYGVLEGCERSVKLSREDVNAREAFLESRGSTDRSRPRRNEMERILSREDVRGRETPDHRKHSFFCETPEFVALASRIENCVEDIVLDNGNNPLRDYDMRKVGSINLIKGLVRKGSRDTMIPPRYEINISLKPRDSSEDSPLYLASIDIEQTDVLRKGEYVAGFELVTRCRGVPEFSQVLMDYIRKSYVDVMENYDQLSDSESDSRSL